MTKEKALYQVKLILDNLPQEEYDLISQETINYIENNMEYSDTIVIIPDIPLEEQRIDPKAAEFLKKIIKEVDENARKFKKIDRYEKGQLLEAIESYKIENAKISEAKKLMIRYKEIIKAKDNEINELKNTNSELYNSISKCPFLIRKIFFRKFDKKLLKKFT